MTLLRKGLAWIVDNAVLSAFIIFAISCSIVVALSFNKYADPEFRDNILIEAHGLLIELFVLGILVLWLDLHRERRFEIARDFDTINECREWESEHAAIRLKGLIQRLNAKGVTAIDLHNCYMKRINLKGANLTKAMLQQADLGEGYLRNVVFDGAQLSQAYLGHADLRSTSFKNANMERVRLQHSDLTGANLRGANLSRGRFNQAILISADLREADLAEAALVGVDLARANLKGAKNVDIEELLKAKTLEYIHMDENLLAQVKARKPELLLKYERENA